MKKYNWVFILILLLSLIFIKPAKASHLLGADIGWKYLGSDTFLISVTVYRDCNGVPMPEQPFSVYTCGSTNGININTIKSEGQDITPLCKSWCGRCKSSGCGFSSGIEQYIFTAKVNLKSFDSSCCKFTIAWEACCRGNIITTGSEGEQYYVDAMIDRCVTPGDNSPVFNTQPIMIFNLLQCNTFSYGCSDQDVDAKGHPDSLAYFLDQPLQGPGSPVNFDPPYAFFKPLIFTGKNTTDPWNPPSQCDGFHLDTFTGELQCRITKTDVSPMNIRVEEWANDASGKPFLKGYTHRDVTIFPELNEPDNLPVLSGINDSDSTSTSICAGANSCFYIDATDPDVNDSVTVTPILPPGIPKNTISIDQGVKHPRTIFCWQPVASDAGKTFQFVMNAADNACPVNGRMTRTYSLHVYNRPVVQVTANNFGCGNYTFSANNTKGGPVTQYNWTGEDGLSGSGSTIIHHYRKPGNYRYLLSYQNAGGCMDTVGGVVSVAAYVSLNVDPKDTLFCNPSTTNITIQANADGGSGNYKYTWQSGATVLSNTNASLTIPVTSDTTLIVTVQDQVSQCTNWDTVKIKATPAATPVKLIPPLKTIFCYNQLAVLKGQASGGYAPNYQYTWKMNGLTVNDSQFVTKVTTPFTLYLYLTDGCSKDSATIHIGMTAPLQLILPHDTNFCYGIKFEVKVGGTGGIPSKYKFSWSPGQDTGAIVEINLSTNMYFTVTLSDGCSAPVSGSFTIGSIPHPTVGFSADPINAVEGQQIQFHNLSIGATSFQWFFGDTITSKLDSPTHSYKDTGWYDVSLLGLNPQGCGEFPSIKKYIHILPAYHLFIPNAFTPNKDSLNDCFQPKGEAYQSFTLEIFSRLGNVIYKGNKCWDGTYKGDLVMEGMFIYHLTAVDNYGVTHSYAGPFYVMRPKNY